MSSGSDQWENLLIDNKSAIETGLVGHLKEDKHCRTLLTIKFIEKAEYEQLIATESANRGSFLWEILYENHGADDLPMLDKFARLLQGSAPEVAKILTSFVESCKNAAGQGGSNNTTVTIKGGGKSGGVFGGRTTITGGYNVDQSDNKVVRNDRTITTTSTVHGSIGYMKSHPEEFKEWAVLCPPKDGNGPGTWQEPSSTDLGDMSEDFFFSNSFKPGKGCTLFINNKFETEPPQGGRRLGAEQDTKSVKAKFLALTGNQVTVAENVASEAELEKVLVAFKTQVLSQKPAYIVVIIGSHGCNNHEIQLENGKTVNLFRHIVCPLSHECPDFKGFGEKKYRLFFVNACQTDPSEETRTAIERNRADSVKPNEPVTASNFFVGFSTLPCQPAYRSSAAGSLYLQAICRHLQKGQKLYPKLKIIGDELKNLKTDTTQISSYLPSYDFPLLDFGF